MSIRLIASDLDGTLLTDRKELSQKTKEVLDLAVQRGIHIVPTTGRSFHSIPEFVRNYPGVEYVITANGGAVYSVSEGRRIYQCLLEKESVEAAIAVRKRENMVLEVVIDGIPYAEEEYVRDPLPYLATEYGARYIKATRTPVKDICRFAGEHAEELDSISFVCSYEDKERLYTSLDKEIPNIYVTSSVPNLMEIGHKDAGKGKTLLWLMKKLEISPDEAMAFGDADNDISMLIAVKYGMAMGNGTENCRKAAPYVTDTNENDGVAKGILQFLQT
ncbi:HAD family hydrolase [Blautia sp. MSJ-19]|uniref:HAD family hydrolase n=1 Tax=Blautia sp. MSJ-19 TaxID=2841517 RepID=UPI001C0EF819|nr:HAD family hydrolase [Blautia sp. MSJ-19]MBU5479798.1 Cof-type HAD-IIB family hydrolase [Blautia sp. MSJ-19]